MELTEALSGREKCYRCYRPSSSCMCSYIRPIETQTKFVILMHPKEFKKTKNGTGHLTHLSLPNSELYIDADFTGHAAVNAILEDPENQCYVLYPGKGSIDIRSDQVDIKRKRMVIFIIDSTWPCSVKMLRLSKNLQTLPRVSFTHTKRSQFQIKEQPAEFCLSTIESTLTVLELLCVQGIEQIGEEAINDFLRPFNEMVSYQMRCAEDSAARLGAVRYKPRSG